MTKYYAGPWVWDDSESSPSPHYRAPRGTVAVVDLRNLPLQSVGQHASGTGHGFFSGPDDMLLPASEYTLLGTGDLRDLQIGGSVRSAWQSIYGVPIPGDADHLIDCLSYTLTDGADPDGLSGPKPLVPCVGPPVGECTINLAGHSVVYASTVDVIRGQSRHARSLRHMMQRELEDLAENDPDPELWRRVLGFQKRKYGQRWDDDSEDWFLTPKLRGKGKGKNGRTFANEPKTTYTESWPSNGAITSGQNNGWSYFDGSAMSVSSNRLTCTAGQYVHNRARMTSAASGSDTYCKQVFVSGGLLGACSTCTRKDSSGTITFYLAQQYEATGGNWWDLYKYVSGSPTALHTSTGVSLSANDVLYLQSNGSAQSAKRNETNNLSATDTAISSGTYGGVGHYSGSASYVTDDWEFGDIGGGGGATRPDLGLLLGVS